MNSQINEMFYAYLSQNNATVKELKHEIAKLFAHSLNQAMGFDELSGDMTIAISDDIVGISSPENKQLILDAIVEYVKDNAKKLGDFFNINNLSNSFTEPVTLDDKFVAEVSEQLLHSAGVYSLALIPNDNPENEQLKVDVITACAQPNSHEVFKRYGLTPPPETTNLIDYSAIYHQLEFDGVNSWLINVYAAYKTASNIIDNVRPKVVRGAVSGRLTDYDDVKHRQQWSSLDFYAGLLNNFDGSQHDPKKTALFLSILLLANAKQAFIVNGNYRDSSSQVNDLFDGFLMSEALEKIYEGMEFDEDFEFADVDYSYLASNDAEIASLYYDGIPRSIEKKIRQAAVHKKNMEIRNSFERDHDLYPVYQYAVDLFSREYADHNREQYDTGSMENTTYCSLGEFNNKCTIKIKIKDENKTHLDLYIGIQADNRNSIYIKVSSKDQLLYAKSKLDEMIMPSSIISDDMVGEIKGLEKKPTTDKKARLKWIFEELKVRQVLPRFNYRFKKAHYKDVTVTVSLPEVASSLSNFALEAHLRGEITPSRDSESQIVKFLHRRFEEISQKFGIDIEAIIDDAELKATVEELATSDKKSLADLVSNIQAEKTGEVLSGYFTTQQQRQKLINDIELRSGSKEKTGEWFSTVAKLKEIIQSGAYDPFQYKSLLAEKDLAIKNVSNYLSEKIAGALRKKINCDSAGDIVFANDTKMCQLKTPFDYCNVVTVVGGYADVIEVGDRKINALYYQLVVESESGNFSLPVDWGFLELSEYGDLLPNTHLDLHSKISNLGYMLNDPNNFLRDLNLINREAGIGYDEYRLQNLPYNSMLVNPETQIGRIQSLLSDRVIRYWYSDEANENTERYANFYGGLNEAIYRAIHCVKAAGSLGDICAVKSGDHFYVVSDKGVLFGLYDRSANYTRDILRMVDQAEGWNEVLNGFDVVMPFDNVPKDGEVAATIERIRSLDKRSQAEYNMIVLQFAGVTEQQSFEKSEDKFPAMVEAVSRLVKRFREKDKPVAVYAIDQMGAMVVLGDDGGYFVNTRGQIDEIDDANDPIVRKYLTDNQIPTITNTLTFNRDGLSRREAMTAI